MSRRTPSDLERTVLADALAAAGPDAPTLCEGWTARDLVAHLVVREDRPDTLPGLRVGAMAGHTERVRTAAAREGFDDLVGRFRRGPSRLSPFRLPGVDAAANVVEHAVHAEDVLRGHEAWTPRRPAPEVEAALWKQAPFFARAARRSLADAMGQPVVVRLVHDDGRTAQVGTSGPVLELRGAPLELVLALLGRRDHADVTVSGDEVAASAWRSADLAA